VRREGRRPVEELPWIAEDLTDALKAGYPVVIANAPFDLSILDAELNRYGLPTLADRMGGRALAPILDPIVLDKRVVERRRRVSPTQGARCLKTLAQVHGVGWDDDLAHTAEYDALQAGRVVWQLMRRFPALARMSLSELHEAQVGWYAEQGEGLRQFFNRTANQREFDAGRAANDAERATALEDAAQLRLKADGVSLDWPIRPFGGAR